MNADIKLKDFKHNIIKPGDKVLLAVRRNFLVERIYFGNTTKSFLFSKYSFIKDPDRKIIEVPAYWDVNRLIKKRLIKDDIISEHNDILYENINTFNSHSILLIERDCQDINPNLIRYVRKENSFCP